MKPTDYPVFLVYSKEDNAWLAHVDLLPGCVADGSTQEEALANARIAVEDWIAVSKELKRDVPKALDLQELEELQIQAQEFHGQQIQQLIQQAVAQVIQQAQSGTLKFAYGGLDAPVGQRGYKLPSVHVAGFSSPA